MPPNTHSTKAKILKTAERLFATGGIEDVSVRQINLAAGQRNACATAYHFGSRDKLLAAVLDVHREGINQRRLAIVAGLRRAGREQELHALAEALVLPLAELLPPAPGGHYLRVMAQVIGHPRYYRLARGREHGEGLAEVLTLLRAIPSAIPADILNQRFGMAMRQIIHELADYQQVYYTRQTAGKPATSLFISNLIDSVAGLLSAPLSAATRWEHQRNGLLSA